MRRHPITVLVLLLAGCGGGGGGMSPPSSAPNPLPTLTALAPATALPGGGAFTLVATGSNFVASSVVNWNGSPRSTTFVSATQLSAQIAATDIMSGGSAAVTVVTPTPGGGSSVARSFNITAVTATVQQIAPAGQLCASAHYQLVATVGPAADSSAARSAHYMMQGGLTGAALNIP